MDAELPLGDFNTYKSTEVCKVKSGATGVTVSGSYTGDLQCHGCDGWIFTDLTVSPGSLRFLGGCGWELRDSTLWGGDRGIMSVMGTGSLAAESPLSQCKTSQNWVVDNIHSSGAGCRPEGDPQPTHVRAAYINGGNGIDMNAVMRNSTWEGYSCGYTVKIGSTNLRGVGANSPDSADGVTFSNNVVRVLPTPPEFAYIADAQAVPILTASTDESHLIGNTLVCEVEQCREVVSNPYPGFGQIVSANTLVGEYRRFMLVTRPPANFYEELNASLYGTRYFVSVTDPNNCLPWATCADNVGI